MSIVNTNEQLASATKRGESEIVIEGDLANAIVRIKLIGPLAWGVAFLSLGAAVFLYLATPAATVASAPAAGAGGGISFGAASASAGAAVAVLGINATIAAIGVAVAAGGVGVLTTLRQEYKIASRTTGRLVLRKVT